MSQKRIPPKVHREMQRFIDFWRARLSAPWPGPALYEVRDWFEKETRALVQEASRSRRRLPK